MKGLSDMHNSTSENETKFGPADAAAALNDLNRGRPRSPFKKRKLLLSFFRGFAPLFGDAHFDILSS